MMRRFLAGACVIALSACGENLENPVGCPELCPQTQVDIQTATVDAVVLDTTVIALTAPGSDQLMLLAKRGDTVDTRVVVRFDSVPARYRPVANDTTTQPIAEIHDARLRLRISTVEGLIADATSIEVFNVDTSAADTNFAALLPLFRADRLIGGASFPAADLAGKDSVFVPLNGNALLPVIQATERLRVGLRVSGATGVQFHVFATESGLPVLLSFRPAADTTVARIVFAPFSRTPASPVELRENLADYMILARVPPAGSAPDLNVGGLPGKRAYMQFVIPSFILDSTTIVRATLLLTQRPNRTFGISDTMGVTVNLVLAGRAVTDIARASTLTADPLLTGIDTIFTAPADSVERSVDIAALVRYWRGVPREEVPHALVLAGTRENGSPLETRFFSIEAVPQLRPRLRISYSPRQPPGLP